MPPIYYIYGFCAVVGGTILVCQSLMTLLGLSDDVDVGDSDLGDIDVPDDAGGSSHHGHHAHGRMTDWLFGVLTFRTAVAALTFFGLVGLGLRDSESVNAVGAFFLALGAGVTAMYGVHWMMVAMQGLRADGTAHIENSVGSIAQVYLRVPPNGEGVGKVTVKLQGRTVEYRAVSECPELIPTGANVRVVRVVSADTVEIEPLETAPSQVA